MSVKLTRMPEAGQDSDLGVRDHPVGLASINRHRQLRLGPKIARAGDAG